MQTPILEAFTNNTSLMKTKLVSLNRQNILFMPIFKLNPKSVDSKVTAQVAGDKYHGIIVDRNTVTEVNTLITADKLAAGYMLGFPGITAETRNNRHIAIDQGIDGAGSTSLDITQTMDSDLMETAYLVKLDNRLLTLDGYTGGAYTSFDSSFVDDDNIATYYIPSTSQIVQGPRDGDRSDLADSAGPNFGAAAGKEVFYTASASGPVGPRIRLHPVATELLRASDALFTEIGTTVTSGADIELDDNNTLATMASYKFIDTVMNVVGITTGYSIDIPLRLFKRT